MDKEYTEKQWEEEMRLSVFCGHHTDSFHNGCILQCPKCGEVGFYGPRIDPDSKKYRACKFCGWWQEVQGEEGRNINNGEPYRCKHFCCDQCGVYDWGITDNLRFCPKGHETKKIDWASDDPNHHFHQLKKDMDQIHQNLNLPRIATE
ncbi:MAG: hypothetical protein HYT21_03175 [Candidatus Nealsonbacteria bacterium]|nr:hypothetical protein [Candidatus Nealsonbacteria bacterium]